MPTVGVECNGTKGPSIGATSDYCCWSLQTSCQVRLAIVGEEGGGGQLTGIEGYDAEEGNDSTHDKLLSHFRRISHPGWPGSGCNTTSKKDTKGHLILELFVPQKLAVMLFKLFLEQTQCSLWYRVEFPTANPLVLVVLGADINGRAISNTTVDTFQADVPDSWRRAHPASSSVYCGKSYRISNSYRRKPPRKDGGYLPLSRHPGQEDS